MIMKILPRSSVILISLLFLSVTSDLCAQSFAERIENDRSIAAGVYHPYVHGDLYDTPAPKGYKPFYISHFGRHGSRYHTTEAYFRHALVALEKAAQNSALTPEGIQLYEDIKVVASAHKGMEGELSPLGGREHKAIARRMFDRFPEVFTSKSRFNIECCSSTVQRCLISMANFSQSLASCSPSLYFSFYTGQKYYDYIAKKSPCRSEISNESKHFVDSLRHAICRYDKMYQKVFSSRTAADSLVANPQEFIRSIYMAGCICKDLDWLGTDIFKYFDIEELTQQICVNSARMYFEYGNSAECGSRSSLASDDLLRDIVLKADEAVSGSSLKAADLRFGHDTGLLPLLGLIGIDGMCHRMKSDKSWELWNTYDRIPMGSNLQMVFYRNSKDDILVKLLFNEQETSIPALEPYRAPYYRWNDLKSYLSGKYE